MGTADRIVRSLAAVAIAGLYLADRIGGVLALVLGTIAGALVFSSLVGWCPVYAPFEISTRGQQTPEAQRG